MKVCNNCGSKKPLTEFYKHLTNKDGRAGTCKKCVRKRERDKYNKHGRKRQDSEYERANVKKYKSKYPEKKRANKACESIKRKKDHLHHWSYKKEHRKDVIHMTIKDHHKAHRFIIYDQERLMYRNLNGELLDTRERHEKYIYRMINEMPD